MTNIMKQLDFCADNNLNVMLIGKHGVGKTAMALDIFKRRGLKFKYYSASTMDPWVDFIGIPKERQDENGSSYIDLIRPKDLENDEVEVIFFDEYNRSHKKIRNAVMELIQFKSVNGKKFKNLKMVWAAINPKDDDEGGAYDVEDMDDAQYDRFHAHIEVPNKPYKKFFVDKFGSAGIIGCDWWNGLSKRGKDLVSPRRLEYLLDVWSLDGPVNIISPEKEINVVSLLNKLKTVGVEDKFLKAEKDGTLKQALSNIDMFKWFMTRTKEDNSMFEKYQEFLDDEQVAVVVTRIPALKKKCNRKISVSALDSVKNQIEMDNSNFSQRVVIDNLPIELKDAVKHCNNKRIGNTNTRKKAVQDGIDFVHQSPNREVYKAGLLELIYAFRCRCQEGTWKKWLNSASIKRPLKNIFGNEEYSKMNMCQIYRYIYELISKAF